MRRINPFSGSQGFNPKQTISSFDFYYFRRKAKPLFVFNFHRYVFFACVNGCGGSGESGDGIRGGDAAANEGIRWSNKVKHFYD